MRGGVSADTLFGRTSWGALTLEVGKSPTATTRRRSAIFEFDSSSSCSWSLNRAVLETDANEQDQGARARPALGACATPWPRRQYVEMLTDERRSARHPGSARRCSSTALRATAGCSARASELSNLAPRFCLRPARRTVAGRCPNMCELVWGEPGTFIKNKAG
eukprot:scaffold53052_cov78-Phaeocystis_antarctica.AAC.1